MLLTSLKQRLVRRIAGFDERKLGYSGFKKLMLRVAEEGNIKIRSVDLVDWILMADEPDPVPQIRVEDDQVDEFEDEPETRSDPVAEDLDADGPEPSPTAVNEPTEDERGRYAVVRREPATPPRGPAVRIPDHSAALEEAVAKLQLQQSDDGGGESDRIADLVAMAYTLEERDGADQVMFNALCAEIGEALAAGIEAEDRHITSHWGDNHSRTYIVRLIRNLASNDVFLYRNVSVRDAETNRLRRRTGVRIEPGASPGGGGPGATIGDTVRGIGAGRYCRKRRVGHAGLG